MRKVMLAAVLAMVCGSLAAHDPPEPIGWGGGFSSGLVIAGGPVLVEVRAIDESREVVLDTKFVVLDATRAGDSAIEVFAPGILEHESHAQMRFQLQAGEHLEIELLPDRRSSPSSGSEAPAPPPSVTIAVSEAGFVSLDSSKVLGGPRPAEP